MADASRPRLTLTSVRDVSGSPTTPLTPNIDTPGATFHNQLSLKRLWDAADADFFRETGLHLETAAPLHKEGVLQKWAARYKNENDQTQTKLDKLGSVFQQIVSGIEVVGAFAASAASTVFGPAQLCFNALTFVLDAPAKIKHVYDCLATLFLEVQDFLIKFKVLERIDAKGRLDVELVDNANRLLIAFVKICGIATRLLKKKRAVLTALAAIFLTSDEGVSAALAEFKSFAVTQAQVIGTISLEHVLENESLSRQILAGQHEMAIYFRSLASRENDEKTRMVIRQKIGDIERKLFLKAELDELSRPRQLSEPLPGTLDKLTSTSEYMAWSNVEIIGQSFLYLSGGIGTGKSCLIESLHAFLDAKRENMLKHGPSLYVAYHNFTEAQPGVISKIAVARALKNMALQVARQSTRYTKELGEHLRDKDLKNETDARKVWNSLKMFEFIPPSGSILYMLFDGLQSEEIKLLLKVISTKRPIDHLKVCVLIAGHPKAISRGNRSTLISMEKLNKEAIQTYIERALEDNGYFEDPDEKIMKQRADFVQRLLRNVQGSFHVAKEKVNRMCETLDDDATVTELEAIIDQDLELKIHEQAQNSLKTLAANLTARNLSQLKKILAWTLYGLPLGHEWRVSDLEAILRLQQKQQNLESLAKKITKRFSPVLSVSYELITIAPDVKNFLLQMNEPNAVTSDETSRFINLTVNIQNATKAEVQRFFLDLNTHLAQNTNIFQYTPPKLDDSVVRISRTASLIEIVLQYLAALNEEPADNTSIAVAYAIQFLPSALHALLEVKDKISHDQHVQIREALIMFLSDPHSIDAESQFQAFIWVDLNEWWFTDKETSRSIATWLQAEQYWPFLQPRGRRWVKHATTRNNNHPDYLQELALAFARLWHAACTDDKVEDLPIYFKWLAGYLDHNLMPTSLDIQNNQEVRQRIMSDNRIMSDLLTKQSVEVEDLKDSTTVDELDQNKDVIDNGSPPDDPDTGTSFPTNDLAAVNRVVALAKWAKKMLLDGKEDAAYNYRIGVSLFHIDEIDAASHFFFKVDTDNAFAWRASLARGHCLGGKSSFSESAQMLRQALDMKRPDFQSSNRDGTEYKMYKDGLEFLAWMYDEELVQTNAAIECLRELVVLAPDNSSNRWFLFRALCEEDHESEAAEMLDRWMTSPKEFGGAHPKEALCVVARTWSTYRLKSILVSIKVQELQAKVFGVFSDAVTCSLPRSEVLARARIMYALAVALAASPESSDHNRATQYLEDILGSSMENQDSWELYKVVDDACRFACLMKFNTLRKRSAGLFSGSTISMLEAIRDDMNNYVVQLSALQSNTWTSMYHYVAALCLEMNRPDWARHVLKEEIADGVEILSDDTPENDRWGAAQLARAFSCYNEDVNAHIAFSLLDRESRRKRSSLREASQKPTKVGIGDDPDDDVQRWCDICGVAMPSRMGYWICRCCGEVDLCSKCMQKFRKGDTAFELCSPDHSFLHLYHPDCAEDEIADGKVFVDWQIEYTDDGSYTRKGGRLVDLDEWLEQIRRAWDLPTPSINARAQR